MVTELREAWRAPPARGVLFMDSMVLAILEGRKTVTRRVGPTWASCKVGDRLWGREAHCWADRLFNAGYELDEPCAVAYRADLSAYAIRSGWNTDGTIKHDRPAVRLDTEGLNWTGIRWRPSIHLPRWACRLDLLVTSVTVQHPPLALVVDDLEAHREGFATAGEFLAAWVALHPNYDGPIYRIGFETLPVGT